MTNFVKGALYYDYVTKSELLIILCCGEGFRHRDYLCLVRTAGGVWYEAILKSTILESTGGEIICCGSAAFSSLMRIAPLSSGCKEALTVKFENVTKK